MGVAVKVLVTGAGGLLGREAAAAFHRSGAEVVAATHDALDVRDAEAVRRAVRESGPGAVVHCAAMTDVDACEADPDAAHAVNAVGAGNVAVAAVESGAVVIAVSTDYVFDGTKTSAYTEHDPPGPIQVYGASKLAGEELVRRAAERHFVVRTSWLYGPGGKSFLSRLPALAATASPLRAVADQTGSPTYAPDLAAALVSLATTDRHGTYHVVNEGACTYADFCRTALEAAGIDAVVKEVSGADLGRAAARPRNTSLTSVEWHLAPLRGWREAAIGFARGGA